MIKILLVIFSLISTIGFAEETRIKIAVIDTGLDITDDRFKNVLCEDGHKDFTNTTLMDIHSHGTHVAGLIKKWAGNEGYCLVIIKYFNVNSTVQDNINNTVNAFQYAFDQNVKFLNFSSGGPSSNLDEKAILIKLINKGVIVTVAAGNQGQNIDFDSTAFYPASYGLKGMNIVGNLKEFDIKNKTSNFGNIVNIWELGTNLYSTIPNTLEEAPMTGTSQAAAVVTGKLIKKYLDAK